MATELSKLKLKETLMTASEVERELGKKVNKDNLSKDLADQVARLEAIEAKATRGASQAVASAQATQLLGEQVAQTKADIDAMREDISANADTAAEAASTAMTAATASQQAANKAEAAQKATEELKSSVEATSEELSTTLETAESLDGRITVCENNIIGVNKTFGDDLFYECPGSTEVVKILRLNETKMREMGWTGSSLEFSALFGVGEYYVLYGNYGLFYWDKNWTNAKFVDLRFFNSYIGEYWSRLEGWIVTDGTYFYAANGISSAIEGDDVNRLIRLGVVKIEIATGEVVAFVESEITSNVSNPVLWQSQYPPILTYLPNRKALMLSQHIIDTETLLATGERVVNATPYADAVVLTSLERPGGYSDLFRSALYEDSTYVEFPFIYSTRAPLWVDDSGDTVKVKCFYLSDKSTHAYPDGASTNLYAKPNGTRYTNPATGLIQTTLWPGYWNKVAAFIDGRLVYRFEDTKGGLQFYIKDRTAENTTSSRSYIPVNYMTNRGLISELTLGYYADLAKTVEGLLYARGTALVDVLPMNASSLINNSGSPRSPRQRTSDQNSTKWCICGHFDRNFKTIRFQLFR